MNLKAFCRIFYLKNSFLCVPYFDWECKCTRLFVSTKFNFLIFNFLTAIRSAVNDQEKDVKSGRFLKADGKNRGLNSFVPNLFSKEFLKRMKPTLLLAIVQKAAANIETFN